MKSIIAIIALLAASTATAEDEAPRPIKQLLCPPSIEMVESGFPGGKVTIQFTIMPDGTVSKDNFVVRDDPGHGVRDNLLNCLTKYWEFPPGLPPDYRMVYVCWISDCVGRFGSDWS